MGSILNTIKKLLGIPAEETSFDTDIIIHINSVFMILKDLGVGPSGGFTIQDELATWEDFLGEGVDFEHVKTYTYLKVKLLFDPPQSSAVVNSMNELIKEFEWRLNVRADSEEKVQNGE